MTTRTLLLALGLTTLPHLAPTSRATVTTLPATATETQIQAAITAAQPGDTIALAPDATYTFTQPLTLKDNLTIDGNGSTWDATAHPTILPLVDANRLQNVTLKNATAKNIMLRLRVSGSIITYINNINITSIRFQDGKAEDGAQQIDSGYILLKAAGVTISQCQFLRSPATPGKAIQLYLAQNTTITACLFGTTLTDGADNPANGWFKTAINIHADSALGGAVTNTTITANKIYRARDMDETGANCDHGIYAHHFDGLEISGNTISGWPPTAAGGAIKLRNAQNFKVINNLFIRSGILLYTYADDWAQYLKNGIINGNTIKNEPYTGDLTIYDGIGYWRNTGTPEDPSEYSIRIAGNTIENGGICIDTEPLNTDGWNADGGGVFDNTIYCGDIELDPGIAQSGNTVTPPPPATAPYATLLTTIPPTTLQPTPAPPTPDLPRGTTYSPPQDTTYTADPSHHTINQLDPDTGATTTISGAPNQPGSNDGAATAARYDTPRDLAADTQGNLYIADTNNHTIRRLDTRTGQVTTLAGRPGTPGEADGPGPLATLTSPDTITITDDGHIYISDANGATLRHLEIAPLITTHPANATLPPGATLTLAAQVTAAPYPAYQWYHDRTPIQSATTATLTLSNITATDTGNYTLTAQNPLGAAITTPATLTLAPAAPATTTTPATTGGGGGGAPTLLYLPALALLHLLKNNTRPRRGNAQL